MTEDLIVNLKASKKEKYELLFPQLKALLEGESVAIANRANFCAALKETFHFLWIGFYHVVEDELVLGNFQGPVACTRIQKGKGVCGTSWEREEAIIVKNVDDFPGHISCNSASKSEIVIPIKNQNGKVISILDIDDDKVNAFDELDLHYLNRLLSLLY